VYDSFTSPTSFPVSLARFAKQGEIQMLTYSSTAFLDAEGKPLKPNVEPKAISSTSNLSRAKELLEPFNF
jgi:hypothetical protein